MVKGRRWKRRSRDEREVERDQDESQLEVRWNLLDSIYPSIVVNYCILYNFQSKFEFSYV